MISCSNVAYSLSCNSREPKLVTGFLNARDNEVGVVNCATSTKNTLMTTDTLMAGLRREEGKTHIRRGKPQISFHDCALSQDTNNLSFDPSHFLSVIPSLSCLQGPLSIPVSKRMLADEDHVVVAVMLLTFGGQHQYGPSTQEVSHEDDAILTLAVAVAGCASTVGVRALTAATHVD